MRVQRDSGDGEDMPIEQCPRSNCEAVKQLGGHRYRSHRMEVVCLKKEGR